MLESLYLLVLHGDMLSKNLKDYAGFIIWCQENLIIRKYVGKSPKFLLVVGIKFLSSMKLLVFLYLVKFF